MSKFLASGRDSSPILSSRESPILFLLIKDKVLFDPDRNMKNSQLLFMLKIRTVLQGVTLSGLMKHIIYVLNPFMSMSLCPFSTL